MPWWWWPLGFVPAAVLAYEVTLGVRSLPDWLPFVVLFGVVVATLLWLGRVEIRVVENHANGGEIELWAGRAHLPATVIARSATVPRTAKSAALGRQLDPGAFVLHRPWIGPMALLILDDPDDPTPYWLLSCRNPERVLAALAG